MKQCPNTKCTILMVSFKKEDKYCWDCGTALINTDFKCKQCNTTYDNLDHFCTQCGYELKKGRK